VNETEAVKMIVDHLRELFPKSCPACGRRFATLKEFYQITEPVGSPISYDLNANNLQPKQPEGAVAVSNCPCGAPVVLTSHGMPLFRYWALLLWAKGEMERRPASAAELLFHLRVLVRSQVLAETSGGGEAAGEGKARRRTGK
jgi:hypothetical protein